MPFQQLATVPEYVRFSGARTGERDLLECAPVDCPQKPSAASAGASGARSAVAAPRSGAPDAGPVVAAPDEEAPAPPRLPQRAAIYIAPDGTVHFGALFKDLVPVASALGNAPDEP